MNLLIQGGRVVDPFSGTDRVADVAITDGRILAIGEAPAGFVPDQSIAAQGCVVAPGLVDLCARLREADHPQAGQLSSERGRRRLRRRKHSGRRERSGRRVHGGGRREHGVDGGVGEAQAVEPGRQRRRRFGARGLECCHDCDCHGLFLSLIVHSG